MSHKDFQRWIDEIIPKIIESLGLDVDKPRYKLKSFKSADISTISNIYHIHLQFKNKKNGQNEELSMILKRPMLGFNEIACLDLQFRNEMLFYQMCARSDESFAKYYYGDLRPPIDSVLALENVNERGYYPCPYMCNAPLEYTLAAMRELGRFHGRGYVMKELQREKFFDIVTQIQNVRYTKSPTNVYEFAANIMSLRTVEYLRRQGYDTAFCDKMEVFFSNAYDEVIIKTLQPMEPLSTLCHGDYLLNNILFKTEDDGQYRSMLIDFTLITYSMPVVDLSTYLCLCCSNEMRKDKFFEIMHAYHDALTEYLLDAGIQDIEKYSYNAFLDDFRRGALFGFIFMCILMPILLGHISLKVLIQEIIELGSLECVKKQKYVGGDEVSKILADALLHLRNLGCLKHIL